MANLAWTKLTSALTIVLTLTQGSSTTPVDFAGREKFRALRLKGFWSIQIRFSRGSSYLLIMNERFRHPRAILHSEMILSGLTSRYNCTVLECERRRKSPPIVITMVNSRYIWVKQKSFGTIPRWTSADSESWCCINHWHDVVGISQALSARSFW